MSLPQLEKLLGEAARTTSGEWWESTSKQLAAAAVNSLPAFLTAVKALGRLLNETEQLIPDDSGDSSLSAAWMTAGEALALFQLEDTQ
ncbi:MAG: hypothetical protein M3540_07705 [Actinomycetota bacterium]|nr:hypothetical protein [Actinomycetota bacterium]